MSTFNFKNNRFFRAHRADSFRAQGLTFERYVVTDPCYVRALLQREYALDNAALEAQLEHLTGHPAIVANNGGDGCRLLEGEFVVGGKALFGVDSGRFAFFRATPEVYAELVSHLGAFFDRCCAFAYSPFAALWLDTANCLDGVQDLIVKDDDVFGGVLLRGKYQLKMDKAKYVCETTTRYTEEERRKKRERERAAWLERHELHERSYWTRETVISELRRRGERKLAKLLNNKFFLDSDMSRVVNWDRNSDLHYVSRRDAGDFVEKIETRRRVAPLWGKKRRVFGSLWWQESVKSGRRFSFVGCSKEGYAEIDGEWVKLYDGAGKKAKLLTKRQIYSTSKPRFEAIKSA